MAPRQANRAWARRARGAGLALCLGLATPVAAEVIVAAEYRGETDRYGHGILGDAIEFGELVIKTADWSNTVRYRALPCDVAPRSRI